MKYIYGPVASRRLGKSLGISTVPYKICSLDCVYCQLKKTMDKTTQRKKYVDADEILAEVRTFFQNKPRELVIDYVTFSGSGEPTLHESIGPLIRKVKTIAHAPVAVITNSTTLMDPEVRKGLLAADLVVPSLDAVTQPVFEKIDRPVPGIRIKDIIAALKKFRRAFRGRLWLEVMLVRGVNDSPAYLRQIKKVADGLKPDRIQINSPVRTPAEKWVRPVSAQTRREAKKIFGDLCDIV